MAVDIYIMYWWCQNHCRRSTTGKSGRHCVVNDATVEGTGLEKLCHIANDATTMQHTIEQLFSQSFSNCEIGMRKELLNKIFNNDNNAAQQVEWIWGEGKYILEV